MSIWVSVPGMDISRTTSVKQKAERHSLTLCCQSPQRTPAVTATATTDTLHTILTATHSRLFPVIVFLLLMTYVDCREHSADCSESDQLTMKQKCLRHSTTFPTRAIQLLNCSIQHWAVDKCCNNVEWSNNACY